MHILWQWKVDFEKVQTLEDVKNILRALDPSFEKIPENLRPFCTLRNAETGEPWNSY